MSELEIVFYVLIGWLNGVILGYILWAPETNFKKGFIDGLSLRFIWGKK